MGAATYAIPNFLGGEISQFAQGRFDKPDYRVSLNVCLNSFPAEIGSWTRRPGTRFAGTTRGGRPGRVTKFDFEQANAVTIEFTDGWLRFRSGATLLTTNDASTVLAISSANPAVVQLGTASSWPTGSTVKFSTPAPSALLENRQFTVTQVDSTHYSLADAITGANIDGSTLGTIATGGQISRVQELQTSYVGNSWANVRLVQAETTDILLSASIPPQALTVTTLPSTAVDAQFSLAAAVFNDGPYLDPLTNGAQLTPGSRSGIVTLTLSFPTYDSTKAYASGSFVTYSGTNYVSLQDQNVGNTPGSSPSFWTASGGGAAVNGGKGFLGSDVGRLIRLLSEPPPWSSTASYTSGAVVSYNPSGTPGAATYWQSQTSSTGKVPGTDVTNWQIIAQGAAIWTWGKITALSNVIDRQLSGSSVIGNCFNNGGNAAAFDGVFAQNEPVSAVRFISVSGSFSSGSQVTQSCFVGKNFGSSPQIIQQATLYPSIDQGLVLGSYTNNSGGSGQYMTAIVTLNLRAKNSNPLSSSDGVLLGSYGAINNTVAAITIPSSDQTTAWQYVWVELVMSATLPANATQYQLLGVVGQLSFFGPPGTGTAQGVQVEILGQPLLYTNQIATWRLGVYSNTTGWPTCGCYDGGRLWLGGAIPNRFDACVSNGIVGSTINFAPTDQYGVVAASNAISYTFNSDSVNPIFWMIPDLQGIVMGTQAGEWLVVAPTSGPISPSNISARRVTKIGCANVEPRRTEHTTVFVQRYGRKLMEYFADVYSGKYSAPNIADKASHIVRSGIAEICYQNSATPIIWGRDAKGALFGSSYKRDTLTTAQGPTYAAWHRHQLGSGRLVESVCVGPSIGGDLDALTMVTNDPATGLRHVEILTDAMDELTPLASSWLLDDSASPSSVASSQTAVTGAPYGGMTLRGLWHLNGKTVSVFAGGLDCGDFAVSNGSCFVPYGDGVAAGTGGGLFTAAFATGLAKSQIAVGFTYNSDGQTVRPIAQAETGARTGPALGLMRRNHRFAMLLSNTRGISVGASFSSMVPADLKEVDGITSIGTLETFSGVHQDQVNDDYSYDGMLCWRVSRPYPATVVAASGNIHTQDQ